MKAGFLKEFDLPVIATELEVMVSRKIVWNSFPGSVVHGVLGMKLKERSCVVTHRQCGRCYLVQSCPYGAIYESKVPVDAERMRLYPQTPHPLRIAVCPWNRQTAEPGDRFRVNLYLYGQAVMFFLSALLAIDDALMDGIGRKHGGARGVGQLLSVRDFLGGREFDWQVLKRDYSTPVEPCELYTLGNAGRKKSIKIGFTTPVKVVTAGKINFNPTVRDVTSALLRRMSNFQYFYNRKEPNIDYKGILAIADDLAAEYRMKRVQAIRYSSRQKKTLSVSGAIGTITIDNCPRDIQSILSAGQYLGVGKSTTMGLGNYSVAS